MYEKIAKRLLEESLSISKEDALVIDTWGHSLDFATAIAVEAEKLGADVLIITATDDLWSRILNELSDEQLKKPPRLAYALLEAETARINIEGVEDPAIFDNMPMERYGIYAERWKPYNDRVHELKIKSVNVQLGMVTPQRAKAYGIDYELWMKEMTESLDMSPHELKEFGSEIAKMLEKTQEVHVTAPGGTNVKFRLAGRPIYVFNGTVDPEEMKVGSHFGGLPSGVVAFAPSEASAEGQVVADIPSTWVAKWVKNLTWTFEQGVLKKWHADENLEAWENIYLGGSGDKDHFAVFGLGLNPNAQAGHFHDMIVKGVVTIGIGDNIWFEGKNNATITNYISISKATVKLDGKPMLVNGEYQI
ncbi:MAG: aminopeptidase [Candidatus Hodarchaeales archaeon]|jgi:leucyl aminopeptidase (aminopeptidase T)